MKTVSYNPSPLEVAFANCIKENHKLINNKLDSFTVTSIEQKIDADNPILK